MQNDRLHCDETDGKIAEETPSSMAFRDTWQQSYKRSSFLFQSSYLPEDEDLDDEEDARDNIRGKTRKRGRRSAGYENKERLGVYNEETASQYEGTDDSNDTIYQGFRILVPYPQHAGQETAESYNNMRSSRPGYSTVTSDYRHNYLLCRILPKTIRSQWTCLGLITLMIICFIAAAVTCGKGNCNRNSRNSSSIDEPYDDSSRTESPSISLFQTSSPTSIPTQTHLKPSSAPNQSYLKAFTSTEELYDAVDVYLENDSPDTNIAQLYGHPIGTWDVVQLTDFSHVFNADRNAAAAMFSADLTGWDTSRAYTLRYMFHKAEKFNGDISNFNTSLVVDMEGMFAYAQSFNSNVEKWQTGSVTNFRDFMNQASNFRGSLKYWDVSSATDMYGMFRSATNFDGVLKYWATNSVRNMSKMGKGLELWDTGSVHDMSEMFRDTPSFNGDLSLWNVSSVESMSMMFREAVTFNSDLAAWNTSNVISMDSMFRHAIMFNSDLMSWNTNKLENMESIFLGATMFDSDISGWNITSVRGMSRAFAGSLRFNHNLCSWGLQMSSLAYSVDTTSMFVGSGCPYTSDPDYTEIESGPFCMSCGTWTRPPSLLQSGNVTKSRFGLPLMTTDELYKAVDAYLEDSSPITSQAYILGHPIGTWLVSAITDFSRVFDVSRNPAAAIFDEDLDWDTSSAANMSRMFAGAKRFNSNLSFNTSLVTDMSAMFEEADRFNGNLSSFDTRNVVSMQSMFLSALSFQGVGLSSWDVSNVKFMDKVFEEALLFQGELSKWRPSQAIDMSQVFQFAGLFDSDIGNWTVDKVESFDSFLRGARSFNNDISRWNVVRVRRLNNMFAGAKAFDQDLCPWGSRFPNAVDARGIFVSTACPVQTDPDSQNRTYGAYCRKCLF